MSSCHSSTMDTCHLLPAMPAHKSNVRPIAVLQPAPLKCLMLSVGHYPTVVLQSCWKPWKWLLMYRALYTLLHHFVMRCEYVAEERVRMERLMIDRVEGWNELGAKEKVVMVMDRVCRDEVVARAVEKMWKKRFLSSVSVPHRPWFVLALICVVWWSRDMMNMYFLRIEQCYMGQLALVYFFCTWCT